MQCEIHHAAGGRYQSLAQEWHGATVEPPFHFRFHVEGQALVFRVQRAASACIHPQAVPGAWQQELWRYDVTEFFIATADASRYLEFNLCPNGAWWAAGFTDPRVPLPGFDARELAPATMGKLTPTGWECEARLPLPFLRLRGWELANCRMAACAVLCREGRYTYLTTCEQRAGKPDFHHPWDWEAPQLTPELLRPSPFAPRP